MWKVWMGRPPSVPPPPHNRQADRSAVESSPLPLPPGLAQGFGHSECGVASLEWRDWTSEFGVASL